MAKVNQVYDGDWVDVTDGTETACCCCGLTHRARYTVLDGRILRMLILDPKVTRVRRRVLAVRANIRKLYRQMAGKK